MDEITLEIDGKEVKGRGKGAKWEGAIIELEMYEDELNVGDDEKARFIPIVFDQSDLGFIPRILKGTNWYDVSDPIGYKRLLRHLKGIPIAIKPKLGLLTKEQALQTYSTRKSGNGSWMP